MKGFLCLLFVCLAHYAAGDSRVRRVVGGTAAPAPGQQCSAPYIVIIRKYCDGSNTPLTTRCAGTIIDNNWVLTSKFCTQPRTGCTTVTQLDVIAGAYVFDNYNEGHRQLRTIPQTRIADDVIPHPDANVDISLIYTYGYNFNWVNNVVGMASFGKRKPTMADIYRATGWGRTTWGGNNQNYATNLLSIYMTPRAITNTHISLASHSRNDAGVYTGDTGGPVIHYGSGFNCGDPEVVSVISCGSSAGSVCNNMGPANHVNVYQYSTWIHDSKNRRTSGASGTHSCGIIITLATFLVAKLL